ncbi:MAG: hypothetical protein ACK4HD_16780 [Pannonibacter phragmitetus]
MMTGREKLLKEIEDFLKDTGMGPSYFGKRSIGSSEVVKRLRSGGNVRLDTAERIRQFISERQNERRN